MTTTSFPGYLGIDDAAREIGIHVTSARRLIKQGQLPARLVFGKYLIERFDLLQFKANYDPRAGFGAGGNARRGGVRRLL